MNTLIIPCAGKSSRFPNTRPKWMLYYPDGKMMIEKAIEGLDIDRYDRIIITIVQDHIDKYGADKILDDIFSFSTNRKMELCVLDNYTSCQAETIYITLEKCKVEGAFAVKDSDNYIECPFVDANDYIVGVNVNTFNNEIERLGAKSFLIVNDQNIITDIIEKRIVSNYICVGLYGFRSVKVFKEAYKHLSDIGDERYEIYLSHIISYLIGIKKSVYNYCEANNYEDWGTLADWYKVLNRKRTVMISLDGTIFMKMEKYGAKSWEKHLTVNDNNMKALKELYDKGNQIIALTSMNKAMEEKIKSIFNEYGVVLHEIIFDCFLSHKVVINTYDDEIPYPGCETINTKVDEDIRGYLWRND